MSKLTENQIEFICDRFFKQHKYPGSVSIGKSLLEKGFAIVAGNESIFIGGVGNFIKLEESPEEYFGCIKYVFDLEDFLKSHLFRECVEANIDKLESKKSEIENSLKNLKSF